MIVTIYDETEDKIKVKCTLCGEFIWIERTWCIENGLVAMALCEKCMKKQHMDATGG